ncbi:hypothetical protein D3C78_1662290 [compost metagenome]
MGYNPRRNTPMELEWFERCVDARRVFYSILSLPMEAAGSHVEYTRIRDAVYLRIPVN